MKLATCAFLAAFALAPPAGAAAADAPARTPELQQRLAAAEAGDAAAMAELGEQYQTGEGAAQDLAQALIWYRKAAEAGNGAGMAGLGSLYFFGAGVTKDEVQARGWFEKAAAAGNARGVNGLALLYANGLAGLPKDPAKAVAMYEQAARAGDKRALQNLVIFFSPKANEPVKDPERLVFWARQAAEAGLPLGMLALADAYKDGTGVAKSLEGSFAWALKAANAGDRWGMVQVGDAYSDGRGVAKNPQQAFAWMRKAAEAGHPSAMTQLAQWYEVGDVVAQSPDQATIWVRKAADLAVGNEKLATALGEGWLAFGSARAVTLARRNDPAPEAAQGQARVFFWFTEAAKLGNASAMTAVAKYYALGKGVAQSNEQALEWLHRAGSTGLKLGPQYRFIAVGCLYASWPPVPRNEGLAAFWYRQGAEAGDSHSMLQLGYALAEGAGVEKDPEQAATWFRRGVEGGDPVAMYYLAHRYRYAASFPSREGMASALWWSGRAADAGDVEAMNLLGELYRFFPPQGTFVSDAETMQDSELKALAWYEKAAAGGHRGAPLSVKALRKDIESRGSKGSGGSGFQWGKAAALLTGASIGGLAKLAPAAKAAIVTGILQDSMAGHEGAGHSLAAVGGLQAAQAQKVVAAGPAAADRDALGDPYPRITVSFECYDTGGGGPGAEPAADGPCLQQERLAKGVQCRADWTSHSATRDLYQCAFDSSTGRFKQHYAERLAWVKSNIAKWGMATGVGRPAPPTTPLAPANRSDVQHDLPSVTPCNHDERGACGTPK